MLKFQVTEGRNDVHIPVALDGKSVGTIKPVQDGWQYFPKDQKVGGEVFKSVTACQRSLTE